MAVFKATRSTFAPIDSRFIECSNGTASIQSWLVFHDRVFVVCLWLCAAHQQELAASSCPYKATVAFFRYLMQMRCGWPIVGWTTFCSWHQTCDVPSNDVDKFLIISAGFLTKVAFGTNLYNYTSLGVQETLQICAVGGTSSSDATVARFCDTLVVAACNSNSYGRAVWRNNWKQSSS